MLRGTKPPPQGVGASHKTSALGGKSRQLASAANFANLGNIRYFGNIRNIERLYPKRSRIRAVAIASQTASCTRFFIRFAAPESQSATWAIS